MRLAFGAAGARSDGFAGMLGSSGRSGRIGKFGASAGTNPPARRSGAQVALFFSPDDNSSIALKACVYER
jgi:hypothetical protein